MKEIFHKQQIEKNPSCGNIRAEYIGFLVSKGRLEDAVFQILQANQVLEKNLKLPDTYHLKVIKSIVRAGEPFLLSAILEDLDTHYDIDGDESLKRVVNTARKLFKQVSGGVNFPEHLREWQWFKSPHYLPTDFYSVAWGKVLAETKEHVLLFLVTVEGYNYTHSELRLDKETWESSLQNKKPTKGTRSFEMVFLNDGKLQVHFYEDVK